MIQNSTVWVWDPQVVAVFVWEAARWLTRKVTDILRSNTVTSSHSTLLWLIIENLIHKKNLFCQIMDMSGMYWGNVFKFGTNIHLDSRINLLEFGGQKSKVKVTVASWDPFLLNTKSEFCYVIYAVVFLVIYWIFLPLWIWNYTY